MRSLFRAWGSGASESLDRGQQNAAPPTQRVDTFPSRKDHKHPHTTYLSSTNLLRRRSTENRGAPLLCAICVSPYSQQPPGSGAANARKTPRPPGRMENNLQQTSKITFRKSLPATRKMPRKPPMFQTSAKLTKAPWTRNPRRRGPRGGPTQHRSPPQAALGASDRARNAEEKHHGPKRTSNKRAKGPTDRRPPGAPRTGRGRSRAATEPSPVHRVQEGTRTYASKEPRPKHSGPQHNFGAHDPFSDKARKTMHA